MRTIAIIGSGQAGLLTAHGLLKAGYAVTLYSDRTADQWLNESRPTGTAARFRDALAFERELELNFWEAQAPTFDGVHLTFCQEERNPLIQLMGRVQTPGMAIDLRLQSHRWLHEFEVRGGHLIIEKVTVAQLDEIAMDHDLVIVATGRGALAQLFPRDAERSVYDKPQRHLAMVIVTGAPMQLEGVPFSPVRFNFTAPIGEAFWVPYYHKTKGTTWNLVFEARPGGAMDRFGDCQSGHEAVVVAKRIIRDFFPWDWEWAKDMELADENGWLVGRFPPTVRQPVGMLPSGRVVMPVGDASMAFDPIGGQGANNGSRMARHLVEAVVAHGDRPFTAAWMRATFEQFYAQHGQLTYAFNNMLLEPITPAGKELLIAQVGSDGRSNNHSGQQAIANAFCENFIDVHSLTPAFEDMAKARAFIEEKTGRHWLWSAVNGRITVAKNQLRHKLGLTQTDAVPSQTNWQQLKPSPSGD